MLLKPLTTGVWIGILGEAEKTKHSVLTKLFKPSSSNSINPINCLGRLDSERIIFVNFYLTVSRKMERANVSH